MRSNLYTKLSSYNSQIGSCWEYNSTFNNYIIGKRFDFVIIDVTKTVLLLKAVLLLLTTLSEKHGSILLNYTTFMNLSLIYKCVLISIARVSNQQIVTYNWMYGTISNYYFSFYYFIKDVIDNWSLNNNYFMSLEQFTTNKYVLGDYYTVLHSNLNKIFDANDNPESQKFFLARQYTKYYTKYITKENTYDIWLNHRKASMNYDFLKQVCFHDISSVLKKKDMLRFKFFFFKIFYYVNMKKKDPFFVKLNKNISVYIEYKVHFYWRFMLYFKHFDNYFRLPDAMFSILPDTNDVPIKEYSRANLLSIGLHDTNSSFKNVQYPIVSNDDSIVLVIFYFTLVTVKFIENELSLYNSLSDN